MANTAAAAKANAALSSSTSPRYAAGYGPNSSFVSATTAAMSAVTQNVPSSAAGAGMRSTPSIPKLPLHNLAPQVPATRQRAFPSSVSQPQLMSVAAANAASVAASSTSSTRGPLDALMSDADADTQSTAGSLSVSNKKKALRSMAQVCDECFKIYPVSAYCSFVSSFFSFFFAARSWSFWTKA
jgi:hypothetical protein